MFNHLIKFKLIAILKKTKVFNFINGLTIKRDIGINSSSSTINKRKSVLQVLLIHTCIKRMCDL